MATMMSNCDGDGDVGWNGGSDGDTNEGNNFDDGKRDGKRNRGDGHGDGVAMHNKLKTIMKKR